jgi:excisionase family DNA binding protein
MRDELHAALGLARELTPEELPRLLGDLEEVRCTAIARLTAVAPKSSPERDELLNVAEACRRLNVSKDYLYRHHREFTFTRRVGRKLLFSSLGIDKYLRQQGGLTAIRHGLYS